MQTNKIYIAIATFVIPVFNILSLKLITTTFEASAVTAFILITSSANILAILIAFGNSNTVQIHWERFKHGSNSVIAAIFLLAIIIFCLGAVLAQHTHKYLMLSIMIGVYFALIAVVKSILQMKSAGLSYLAVTIFQTIPFFIALVIQNGTGANFAEFARIYFVLIMLFTGSLALTFVVVANAKRAVHFSDIGNNLVMGSAFVFLSFQSILINQFDRFLIPHLGLESSLLPYVVTAQFLSPISLLVAIIVNANLAKVYNAYDQDDKVSVVKNIAQMYLVFSLLCFAYIVLFIVLDIQKLLYPDIEVSTALSLVLGTALFFLGSTSINNLLVYKEQRQNHLSAWLFVCFISSVSVGYLCGSHYGLIGVAIGQAFGYLLYFLFGIHTLFHYQRVS